MQLSEFLCEDRVVAIDAPADKPALLRYLADLAGRCVPGLAADRIFQGLMEREAQASTGVGLGIAMPHCVMPGLADNQLFVCRVRGGLAYEAIDGEPVHLVFMVLAPERRPGRYLQLLARLTRLVHQAAFRRRLMETDEAGELYRLLKEQDAHYASPAVPASEKP